MNKKIISILILIALMLPVIVSADARSSGSFLGGIETNILDTVVKILNYEVRINMFNFSEGNQTGYAKAIPLWALFASFGIIYAVLWIASSKIQLFQENRTPRIIFVLGVTLIAMFTTPVASWILGLIGGFTTIAILLMVGLAAFIGWTMIKSTWANTAVVNAEASRSLADASRVSAEVSHQSAQTDEYKKKIAKAINTDLTQQVKAIQRIKEQLKNVVSVIMREKNAGHLPLTSNSKRQVENVMNRIQQDLGKISSFKTEGDRLMAGMSKKLYSEGTPGSLGGTTRGGLVQIQKDADTETNDAARSIIGLSQVIVKGIIDNQSASDAVGYANSAINHLNRMEKDIVLEEQMIERM
jgi:hypothetical protein